MTSALLTNIVRYYKLDEESGDTVIDSTEAGDGINYGATINVPGILNTSYTFIDDYVDSGYTQNITSENSISFSLWIKTTNGKEIIYEMTGSVWS